MTCRDNPIICLTKHVIPYLDDARASGKGPWQQYAKCPAHDDDGRALSISTAESWPQGRRLIWCCHREPVGCTEAEIRAALVLREPQLDGHLDRCKGQRTEDELVAAIAAIYESEPPGNRRELMIAAIVLNRGKLPAGPELTALGERIGMRSWTVHRAFPASERSDAVVSRGVGQPQPPIVTTGVRLRPSYPDKPQFTALQGMSAEVADLQPDLQNCNLTGRGTPPLNRTPVADLQLNRTRCDWCDAELTGRQRVRELNYCSEAHRKRADRSRQKSQR